MTDLRLADKEILEIALLLQNVMNQIIYKKVSLQDKTSLGKLFRLHKARIEDRKRHNYL